MDIIYRAGILDDKKLAMQSGLTKIIILVIFLTL